MNICLSVNSSPWSRFKGGGQIAVHHLATALSRRGHQVWVLYSKSPDESIDPETEYNIRWVRHFEVATFNLNIFSFAWGLFRLARNERLDVIHGNAEEAFLFRCWKKKAVQGLFFTSHAPYIPDTSWLGGLMNPVRFLKSLNTYFLRGAAKQADRVITFSEFSKQLVVKGLGQNSKGRVSVLSPGIDPSWLQIKNEPGDGFHIVFWGRLEKEKGIHELLEAFQSFAKDVSESHLTLIGEGNQMADCQDRIKQWGLTDRVTFTGWQEVSSIQNIAARSHVAVFPSHVESFGLAVAEGLGAGLPVVATEAGALPEIVESGITGTLVPPRNAEALHSALLLVYSEPEKYRALAKQGRDRVKRQFSWDVAAEHLEKIYQGTRAG